MKESNKAEKKITNEKPLSLAGPSFKELMKAFLKVKPEDEKEAEKKPAYMAGFLGLASKYCI